MLVIVNPYATTVSDRLKNLVVYALQGRYEVDAMDTEGRDHATILCREAAEEGYDVVVAFGGRTPITDFGTVIPILAKTYGPQVAIALIALVIGYLLGRRRRG